MKAEQANRRRQQLRATIQAAKVKGSPTVEAVTAFAALHLRTDEGYPVEPAAHHALWLQLLTDENIKKLLIIAPPESAKTTWAVMAYAGCYVGFYPERSIIIGSTSGAVAEKRSLALRNLVDQPGYVKTFPSVLPVKGRGGYGGLKWGTNEWSLAYNGEPTPGRLHPTLAAYGTGGSVIGSRADLVIADDLLDFDNTRTAHQRKLVETWLHNSLLSRRKSRTGRVIVIGTAWHHDDIYSKARKEGDWVICHTPLLSAGKDVYANLTYPAGYRGTILGQRVAPVA